MGLTQFEAERGFYDGNSARRGECRYGLIYGRPIVGRYLTIVLVFLVTKCHGEILARQSTLGTLDNTDRHKNWRFFAITRRLYIGNDRYKR